MQSGLPQIRITAVGSRATRAPERLVSAISPRFSRVQSSLTARIPPECGTWRMHRRCRTQNPVTSAHLSGSGSASVSVLRAPVFGRTAVAPTGPLPCKDDMISSRFNFFSFQFLLVHRAPLPLEKDANALIAKLAAGARDLMHLLADIRMIWRPLATHCLGVYTNQVANPALRDLRRLLSRTNGVHRLHPASP